MVELVGRGFSFTEGPRWHEGALWFSDFYTHRVIRWDGGAFHTVCEVPGQPSGLGFSPDGELLVVSMIERRLMRLRAGALEVVAELADHCPGPANDMCVDAAGRAYIGNDGPLNPLEPTVLVRVDPDGAVASPPPTSSHPTASSCRQTEDSCSWQSPSPAGSVHGTCSPTVPW